MLNSPLSDPPRTRSPDEGKSLKFRSRFLKETTEIDQTERTLDRLFQDLLEDGGHLSHVSREGEFRLLTDQEVQRAQAIFRGLSDQDCGTHWGQQ